MRLQPHWRVHPWLGYLLFGFLGAAIFCGYWGFIGKITKAAGPTEADRLEFLARRQDRIRKGIHFMVKLDRAYLPDELDPFRIVMQATSYNDVIWAAAYGPRVVVFYNGKPLPGSQNVVWFVGPDDSKTLMDATLGWEHNNTSTLEAVFFPQDNTPFQSLTAFDGAGLAFFVSESILPKVKYIVLYADDYILLALSRRCVDATDIYQPGWPPVMHQELRDHWSKETWIRLVPKGFRPDGPRPPVLAFSLSFNDYTPMLVRDFNGMDKDSIAFPTCSDQ